MADIPPDPALLGVKLAHIIAGGLGGLVRSLTTPGGTMTRHITTAIVGTIVAGYGTPLGAHLAGRYFGVPEIPVASLEGMVGFVLGLAGMSLCEMVLRWVRAWRDGPPPKLPLPPVGGG